MNIFQKNKEQYYPFLVAKLIHERYSPDAETALINNYLADPETYGEEYRAYQAFRSECKQRAKESCGIIPVTVAIPAEESEVSEGGSE